MVRRQIPVRKFLKVGSSILSGLNFFVSTTSMGNPMGAVVVVVVGLQVDAGTCTSGRQV